MRKRRLRPYTAAAVARPEFALCVGAGSCFMLAALEIVHVSPWTALWATPAILLSAMLIAWAAESAQFFIAQGFALAILAWLQTLPEFAVEAVLAWKQQVPLLLANLTGALRLLTGLGWPMIYGTAAFFHRRKYGRPTLSHQARRRALRGSCWPARCVVVHHLGLFQGIVRRCGTRCCSS